MIISAGRLQKNEIGPAGNFITERADFIWTALTGIRLMHEPVADTDIKVVMIDAKLDDLEVGE